MGLEYKLLGGNIMEKIVIRTEIASGNSSRFIYEINGDENLKNLLNRQGVDKVLKNVFNEKNLSYEFLYKEYDKFIENKKSLYFTWMYIINSKFGVVLDEHIYLYVYNDKFLKEQRKILPWAYMESKIYLGDTWWFDDNEIILDLQKLSIIDFLDKYKGY